MIYTLAYKFAMGLRSGNRAWGQRQIDEPVGEVVVEEVAA